ncbi:MAG: M57 family metalloprotease [Christensenellaceae bacterium]|jgi:hypothetical protein|nr:M57 family metalloprotease [Christensenellaceae bacterium]
MILSACNPTEARKRQAVKDYGEAKAYNKTQSGAIRHLPYGTISYYIPSSVAGSYKTISEYAIAKANTLTSTITITTTTASNSSFKYSIVSTYSDGTNAYNTTRFSATTGVISGSTITYVKSALDSKNLQYKKHTALHELGHTFGLCHIEATEMAGWTVMISPHPATKYELDDYSEFDRYNVEWQYGE